MFILRDVLKYETSLEGGISRIQTSNRTCNLIIGLGDGEESMVNGIEFSGYVAIPYSDQDLLPTNETWHPVINDVVYNGMDWLWYIT
jgi:isopenicillin-N N-acyltransferase like protein